MIRALIGHIVYWIRGCSHPTTEPIAAYVLHLNGEKIAVFEEGCTVCRTMIITTD